MATQWVTLASAASPSRGAPTCSLLSLRGKPSLWAMPQLATSNPHPPPPSSSGVMLPRADPTPPRLSFRTH